MAPRLKHAALAIATTLTVLLVQPACAAEQNGAAPSPQQLADGPTPGKPPGAPQGLIEWLLWGWI